MNGAGQPAWVRIRPTLRNYAYALMIQGGTVVARGGGKSHARALALAKAVAKQNDLRFVGEVE